MSSYRMTVRKWPICVNLEKCEFLQHSVKFPGYISDDNVVEMDQSKLRAITSCTQPKMTKKLQQLLGFTNYYQCFIWGFSIEPALLTSLPFCKVNSRFWSGSLRPNKHLKLSKEVSQLPQACVTTKLYFSAYYSRKVTQDVFYHLKWAIEQYVKECQVCTEHNPLAYHPVGCESPFPIPHCSWLLSVSDFITDHPK